MMVERRRHSSEEWRSQFAALVRLCAPCYPLSFLFSIGAAPELTELFLSRIGGSVFTAWHESFKAASIQPDSEAFMLNIPGGDSRAVAVIAAIHNGNLEELER